LFPGLNFLLTTWYNRNEQNMVVSLFFAGSTLAGAFGGILAFGIRHMDGVGGKGGWAWMCVTSIRSVLVAALIDPLITSSP
jgi:MFS family permease